MLHLIDRLYLTIIIFSIALVTAGCDLWKSGQEIPPVASLEAEAVSRPEATTESRPVSTGLPTEVREPVSPISPISPLKEPEMTVGQGIQPIKGSEEALAAVLADLTTQTGVAADEITLVSIEAVEWSDTSLGCPREGFMYAQVITPGYLMVLEAGGEQYEYHTDQKNNVVLCPK